MVKYYCDKCKKEIDSARIEGNPIDLSCNIRIQLHSKIKTNQFSRKCFEGFLCEECFKTIEDYLENNCKRYNEKLMR